MGGDSGGSAPDDNSVEVAEMQGEAARLAALTETHANRPDQYGPMGNTTWDNVWVDPVTGQEVFQAQDGTWIPASSQDLYGRQTNQYLNTSRERISGSQAGYTNYMIAASQAGIGQEHMWSREQFANASDTALENHLGVVYGERGGGNAYSGPEINPVEQWTQNTVLDPQWQAALDDSNALLRNQISYRSDMVDDWSANPVNLSSSYTSPEGTISRSDLAQFGTTSPNLGAQDWRQFGTTENTINADQWQNLGYTDATLGADDWRQFGTTEQTLTGGTYDQRFGDANADPTYGYGDHGMDGGDWNLIQYEPEAIRRQAEQQTLDFMNSQLDPQWDTKYNDLQIQLANQGLQWGDAAYDNAMSSFSTGRNNAYAGARNQALADSRAEAAMLWDQEMAASTQKNFLHQSDIDNIYRARQSNIENAFQNKSQEQQNYLAYQEAAFGQDLQSRQQQINADLGYGRESFQQDLMGRQQALDAQLGYGRESWNQDFNSRQQQLDANRAYSNDAFSQEMQARQANITNYLNYGNAEFGQGSNIADRDLQAAIAREQLMQGRYGLVDPAATSGAITAALGG